MFITKLTYYNKHVFFNGKLMLRNASLSKCKHKDYIELFMTFFIFINRYTKSVSCIRIKCKYLNVPN